MNKRKAMAWVKALRSGKYKQGMGYLKKDNNGCMQYCCLGVLGEISKIGDEILLDETITTLANDDGKKKCGIRSNNGSPQPDLSGKMNPIRARHGKKVDKFLSLADANDSGVSFKAIATWIEKNYELL